MLRVLKQGQVSCSDQVVKIPDYEPPAPEEPLLEEEEAVSVIDETEKAEEEARAAAKIAEEFAYQRAKERAEDFSERIIKSAHMERDKILEQAQTERTRMLQEVQEAKQQGYQDAYGEFKEQISDCLSQVDLILDEIQQRQKEFIQQYEQDLRFLAVDIAEKFLRKHIFENEEDMAEMVKQAVSSIKNAEWISVEISDKLPRLVEQLKTEFAAQAGEKNIEVFAQDIEVGSCVLNTPEAIVDVSLSSQMDNLREVFKEL